jgi:hypothetical protein
VAQVLQRRLLRLRRHYGSALDSWFLDLISRRGFKPGRSYITYFLVIIAFAAAFFALGSGVLGLGGLALDDPITILELYIEITFIATFASVVGISLCL